MRNKLLITSLIILAGLSACKDEKCLTCPANEAVVNGKCECIGIKFGDKCLSRQESLDSSFLNHTNIQVPLKAFISEPIEHNAAFEFNNQTMFFYLQGLYIGNNFVEDLCGIRVASRTKPYLSQLRSPLGSVARDTLTYYAPSAFDYEGFVSNIGGYPGEHFTTEIEGQTCYLRPYVKILDKDVLRVTFRYVTSDETVKAECVRIFTR